MMAHLITLSHRRGGRDTSPPKIQCKVVSATPPRMTAICAN